MSRKPQMRMVRLSELKSDRPTYQPLVDILAERRSPDATSAIYPSRLKIEPAWRHGDTVVAYVTEHFRTTTLHHQEFDHWILVLRRQDGSLWVYDDCAYIQAAWRVAPNTPVKCAVWNDPTQ